MEFEHYDKLRKERGLTHADVARAAGVLPSVFSEWKKGKSTPKYDKLQKIASVLGVPVEYFATGTIPGVTDEAGKEYQLDEETLKIAEDIYALREEDRQSVADMVRRLKAYSEALKGEKHEN